MSYYMGTCDCCGGESDGNGDCPSYCTSDPCDVHAPERFWWDLVAEDNEDRFPHPHVPAFVGEWCVVSMQEFFDRVELGPRVADALAGDSVCPVLIAREKELLEPKVPFEVFEQNIDAHYEESAQS